MTRTLSLSDIDEFIRIFQKRDAKGDYSSCPDHSIPVGLPARGAPAFDKKFIQGPSKGRCITSAVSGFWFLVCLVPGFQDFVKRG